MGLLDKLKKKPLTLSAAVKGKVIPMADIPDEVFSQGILGLCLGVDPAEGTIHAPFDGKITQLPDTFHAVGIQGANGLEVLLHVGVDTVDMKGSGFAGLVKEGDTVTAGQPLLTVDLEKVKAAGHPAVVIHVLIDSDSYSRVDLTEASAVEAGSELMRVTK